MHTQLPTVPMVLFVAILNQSASDKAIRILSSSGVTMCLVTIGHGTAVTQRLSYFGLDDSEKDVVLSTMPLCLSGQMVEKFEKSLSLKKPGNGLVFTVPIGHVADARSDKCMRGNTQPEVGGCSMKEEIKHELIIAITNRGYTDDVMEAARASKATRGTVIHARRVAIQEAEKFFGVSLQPEKELVLILSVSESRQAIMQSIAENTGMHTDAKTVVFSMPVSDVRGLADN